MPAIRNATAHGFTDYLPAGQYRVVLPGGQPLPAGTQVIGRGSHLHFLTGTSWYQLDMDDIPA
jgi:hypothetical protein